MWKPRDGASTVASRLDSKQFSSLSTFLREFSLIYITAFVDVQIALIEIIDSPRDRDDTITELEAFANVRAFPPFLKFLL